jgi:aspartate/methionine/tyrosine aminotransferase
MRPLFQTLEGGLFSSIEKADVGDIAGESARQGIALMCWADPFFPDPSIPQAVLDKSIETLKSGFPSHYTMPIGNPQLKTLIARRVKKNSGIDLDPQRNIIINPGSDIGLFFAMTPFINPGDEALVPDPSYPSNFLNPKLLNGVTVPVPTYEEDNYRLRVEEFEKRLTPKTKMVLLSSPNNPTGSVYTRQELSALAEFIIKNNLVCVCDQAFEDTVMPPHEMVSIASLPGMWERTLTVCSVSKGMGLSGYRVGYIYANDVIMDALYGSAVNIQGAANTMAQVAVMPAFEDDSFIAEYLKKFQRRADFACELFNSIPGVSMNPMESGFYSWVNVAKLGNSGEIVNYLKDTAKVLCNDGKFYGENGNGHLRIIHGAYWDDEKSFAVLRGIGEALRKRAHSLGI